MLVDVHFDELDLALGGADGLLDDRREWLQGPHHGAQKSIRTGWRLDSSMTSLTNVCVVVSLMRSDAPCGAGPLPCSIIVT